MKLHLKIEKRAEMWRTREDPQAEADEPELDDSMAVFSILGVEYYSKPPENAGEAITINEQLEQLAASCR